MNDLYQFVQESNLIEGILREPTEAELEAASIFMKLGKIKVQDLNAFVNIYEPGTILRNKVGMNVRVGNYFPPSGGPFIERELKKVIEEMHTGQCTAYYIHRKYETLHPYTDCNGRSGRMLWAWQMGEFPLGFLHTWYYQSLRRP